MRKLFIILLSLFTFFAQAQDEPVILPPFGHAIFSSDFDIDVESKTIVTVGLDGYMVFWDIAAQKAYRKILAHSLEIYSVRYSWNGEYIITSSVDMTVRIWKKDGTFVDEINTGSSNLYAEFNREENKIAVASADGHSRIYEFPSKKLLFELEAGKKFVNCANFSTNGRLVFTGDDEGTLNAFDIENSGKSLLNTKLDAAIKMVTFDWAGSAMIIHTMNGMGEVLLLPSFQSMGRIQIPTVDYQSGAAKFVSNMDISPDSKWLVWANANHQIQIISGEKFVAAQGKDGALFETAMIPLPHDKIISKVKFSPDMRYIVTLGHDKKICVLEIDGVDLELLDKQYVSTKIIKQYMDYIRSIYFDEDKNIHMRGMHTYTWNMKTSEYYTEYIVDTRDQFLREELTKVTFNKIDFYYDANRDIVLINKGNKLTDPDEIVWSKNRKKSIITYEGKAYLLDINEKNIISNYAIPITDENSITALSVSGDLLIGKEKNLRLLDKNGKKVWETDIEANVSTLDISLNEEYIAVGHYGKSLLVLNKKDGKKAVSFPMNEAQSSVVCFMPDNDQIAYTGYYGGIGLASIKTKKANTLVENSDFSVFALTVSDDGKMIASIGYDRLIRLYHLEVKKELFNIYPMQEYGMAVVNEDGYYMSDKKAYKELAFWYNDKIYTGDQFDAIYNRPDLVLNASPYADAEYVNVLTQTWNKRMKRLGIDKEKIQVSNSSITLNNAKDIKRNSLEKEVKIDLKVTDSIEKIEKLIVTLNDVPLYGREGMDFKLDPKTKSKSIQFTLPVLPDKNVYKIIAVNEKGAHSLPEIVEINSHREDDADLYLVAMGTSKYKDERFNLNYAAKDAEDMESLFKNDKRFSKVNTLTLTDEKVTSKSLDKIKSFLSKAKSTDVVMVFVAGHGVLDADMNYYLATNETNFLKPSEGGIKYEELEAMFETVPAIRKTLLLDACHSGELDKDEVALNTTANTSTNSKVKFRSSGAGVLTTAGSAKTSVLVKELFADMRAGTGANVLSSAGGAEYAMESADYKNGLFTYSLIDGIKTMAADLDGDGKIMLSELQQYISGNVLELSGGKQRPTSRVENLSMDFQIW